MTIFGLQLILGCGLEVPEIACLTLVMFSVTIQPCSQLGRSNCTACIVARVATQPIQPLQSVPASRHGLQDWEQLQDTDWSDKAETTSPES